MLRRIVIIVLGAVFVGGWLDSCRTRRLIHRTYDGGGGWVLESNAGALYCWWNMGSTLIDISRMWYRSEPAGSWEEELPGHTVRRWQGVQVFSFQPNWDSGRGRAVVVSYWVPTALWGILLCYWLRRGKLRRYDARRGFEVSGSEAGELRRETGDGKNETAR